jgi:hypothetical protein
MPDERSNALPRFYYDDPADVVERLQQDLLGCRLCTSHQVTMGRVVCGDERNSQQRGVPDIGHRCRYFNERR